MRSSYKHYRNHAEPGQTVFFTSTVLDFVKVFAEPFNADLMAASLLDDLRVYGAELYAFVVMGHHIHLLAAPPDGIDPSRLMERIKANAARRLAPRLSVELLERLSQQRGLNRRSLWQRSFRSIAVTSPRMFAQKVRYIHQNPVRAGLCASAGEYRWSSAWMYLEGYWRHEGGLLVDEALVSRFCDRSLLRLTNKRAKADEDGFGEYPPPLGMVEG